MIHRVLRVFSRKTAVPSRSLWDKVPLAPKDPIFNLTAAYNEDTFEKKINLGVGAYRDDEGKAFVLPSVREAEKRLVDKHLDHEYASIAGIDKFVSVAQKLAFGKDSVALKKKRVATIQSLSGTGSLRVIAEFLRNLKGSDTPIYLPDPTWGNHYAIMRNAGLSPKKYRYYDPATCAVNFGQLEADILGADEGSVFLLHACAHNPTGCDPSPEEWDVLSALMKEKQHVVLFDSAYQGFASGDPEQDAYAIRKFTEDENQIILCQSFSKNFGLYGERVGAASVVTETPDQAAAVKSQLSLIARAMYSNPPIHGARIVAEVLSDEALTAQWLTDCRTMTDRIKAMRQQLRDKLEALDSSRSWKHLTDQIGMFCYTGLTLKQVAQLKTKYHIYCTDDGRFSTAGINTSNIDYLVEAVHAVTHESDEKSDKKETK